MGETMKKESIGRGMSIRTDIGPDRGDTSMTDAGKSRDGELKGGKGDLSHSISGNKVPEI